MLLGIIMGRGVFVFIEYTDFSREVKNCVMSNFVCEMFRRVAVKDLITCMHNGYRR